MTTPLHDISVTNGYRSGWWHPYSYYGREARVNHYYIVQGTESIDYRCTYLNDDLRVEDIPSVIRNGRFPSLCGREDAELRNVQIYARWRSACRTCTARARRNGFPTEPERR